MHYSYEDSLQQAVQHSQTFGKRDMHVEHAPRIYSVKSCCANKSWAFWPFSYAYQVAVILLLIGYVVSYHKGWCLSQIITIVDMNWFQMFRNNMLIDELKRPWSLANANQWKQSFEKDILFQLRTEGWMTSSQSLRALCFIVIPPYVSHISVDKMPWICYVSSSPNSAGSDYAQKTKARPFHLSPKINGPFASIFMKKRLIVCACHTRISYFRLAERQISLCHNIK